MNLEIKIENHLPAPTGRFREDCALGALRKAIASMKPGESFLWPKENKHPYEAAKQIGARITLRKQPGGGWRIWLRQKGSAPL